jgi:hypothetical protein
VREKRIALKHHAECTLFSGQPGNFDAVLVERAGACGDEACEDHQECRLAGTGGAEQRQEFPTPDVQRDVAERVKIPIGLANPLGGQFCRPFCSLHCRSLFFIGA